MTQESNEPSGASGGSVARRKERLLKKWGRGGHLSDEEVDYLDRHIPYMYDQKGKDDRGGTHE